MDGSINDLMVWEENNEAYFHKLQLKVHLLRQSQNGYAAS